MSCLTCVTLAAAWLYLGNQAEKAHGAVQQPVRFMHTFFLYMAIFAGIISLPYFWLGADPAGFPLAMAWGYVIGHVFAYLAFLYIARTTFALIPRLSSYDKILVPVWLIVSALVTIVNAKTMIWGVRPIYNYTSHLTELRAAPIVGASIAVIAMFAFLPAIVLFVVATVKARGIDRVKPATLALGFLLLTIAGPMHDIARSDVFYAIADVVSIISVLVIDFGVVFRIEHRLADIQPRREVFAAPSNTV